MSDQKVNQIADSIAYLAEQFQRETGSLGSNNIVEGLDKIAHSLWDGLRNDGGDNTIPDALYAVSESLDKIADAINKGKGE
tara:strand:+ start:2136 stop:2378 length:243 start_codon:yes stop_codon:yes gene_type:complete